MTKAAAAGVDLDKQGAGLLGALQLDEVIAAAQRANLTHAALGPPRAAHGNFPRVVDRNAVPLGLAAVEVGTVLVDVVLGAAAHQLVKLALVEAAQLGAEATFAHLDALHDRFVKGAALLGRGFLGGDLRAGAHHAAADVKADRTHRHCAPVRIGQDHAADGHAVAVVTVGSDGDQLHARKAGGVDDLAI